MEAVEAIYVLMDRGAPLLRLNGYCMINES